MFFGLVGGKRKVTYSIVLDVGSGSVGIGIVASTDGAKYPKLVWTMREPVVRERMPSAESIKCSLQVSIQNVLKTASSRGMTVLRAEDPRATISHVQATIAAPWSYTITKTVHVRHKTPFTLSKEVIEQMTKTARTEAHEEFKRTNAPALMGLAFLSNTMMNVYANGYHIKDPIGKRVTDASSEQLIDLADADLVQAIEDGIERTFPGAERTIHSFMRIFYAALCELHVQSKEVCLVDVSDEATEVGIVRNGMLVHVSHIPYGTTSIARMIGERSNLPLHEGMTYLRGDSLVAYEKGSAKVGDIISEYDAALIDVIRQSGSVLTMSKSVFLHTDQNTESFFERRLLEVAKQTNTTDAVVHKVTSRFMQADPKHDSALLVAAYVLHASPFVCTWK